MPIEGSSGRSLGPQGRKNKPFGRHSVSTLSPPLPFRLPLQIAQGPPPTHIGGELRSISDELEVWRLMKHTFLVSFLIIRGAEQNILLDSLILYPALLCSVRNAVLPW